MRDRLDWVNLCDSENEESPLHTVLFVIVLAIFILKEEHIYIFWASGTFVHDCREDIVHRLFPELQ